MSEECIRCGACCASFRVSFYWAETDAYPDGLVPAELTEAVSPYFVAMRGTNRAQPRCAALQGDIGAAAGCGIYERRSSTCREFEMGDERCVRARDKFGLPPLS